MGAYTPFTEKKSKILNKNLARTSCHSMCASQVWRKSDIFLCIEQKRQKDSLAKPFLAPNFIFLQTPQKISLFC
jgi:hypothetical protein